MWYNWKCLAYMPMLHVFRILHQMQLLLQIYNYFLSVKQSVKYKYQGKQNSSQLKLLKWHQSPCPRNLPDAFTKISSKFENCISLPRWKGGCSIWVVQRNITKREEREVEGEVGGEAGRWRERVRSELKILKTLNCCLLSGYRCKFVCNLQPKISSVICGLFKKNVCLKHWLSLHCSGIYCIYLVSSSFICINQSIL